MARLEFRVLEGAWQVVLQGRVVDRGSIARDGPCGATPHDLESYVRYGVKPSVPLLRALDELLLFPRYRGRSGGGRTDASLMVVVRGDSWLQAGSYVYPREPGTAAPSMIYVYGRGRVDDPAYEDCIYVNYWVPSMARSVKGRIARYVPQVLAVEAERGELLLGLPLEFRHRHFGPAALDLMGTSDRRHAFSMRLGALVEALFGNPAACKA